MIKNYLKITLRKLLRNKVSSLINITGLAVGLTCCLLMVLFIRHETSYDDFQEKGDRIVRVIMESTSSGGDVNKGNYTSARLFPVFQQQFPEVESGVRITLRGNALIKADDEVFVESKMYFVDSTFFEVFSFPLLKGNPATALDQPRQVVLSSSTAQKYFGQKDPVGKTILLGASQVPCTVTGVMADFPSNSHIKFDAVGSLSTLYPLPTNSYSNANYVTYLLLKDAKSAATLQAKIPDFLKKDANDQAGINRSFELEPFKSIHLYSPYDGFEAGSSITTIYISAGIALLILIIACFTYINLSTARSIERAREVGIRKVAGARKNQVFWQFIGESAMLTVISLLLSLVLMATLLPGFNRLTERTLSLEGLAHPAVIFVALFIVTVIVLLAGSYPALILSRFKPATVLKGVQSHGQSGNRLRKSLTVFQFTISAFLVIVTFVMQRQLHYIQNKKLGYDREHTMVVKIDQKVLPKMDLLKSLFKSNPAVTAVSRTVDSPVEIKGGYSMTAGTDPAGKLITTRANPVDEEYIKASGIELIAGNDLTLQDVLAVSGKEEDKYFYQFLLNESAVAAMGWTPATAIGQRMFLGEGRPGQVKGVVRDFHFQSLHKNIEPLVIFPDSYGDKILVKVNTDNPAATIASLEKSWKTVAPHRPFDFRFLDEDFNRMYTAEMQTGRIFNIFSVVAIILACLGLFGLSVYAVQQRTKEIGIRKVLGASTLRISGLLVSQFLVLVVIAFVIAAPLAWVSGEKWLQDFAYRIQVEWWMVALAGASLVGVAILTVGIKAVKAAMANPVKSLRNE